MPRRSYDFNETSQEDAMRADDQRFMRSMIKAIARGHEKPPAIGAVRDPRPSRAKRIHTLAPRSYTGSQAYTCADNDEY